MFDQPPLYPTVKAPGHTKFFNKTLAYRAICPYCFPTKLIGTVYPHN